MHPQWSDFLVGCGRAHGERRVERAPTLLRVIPIIGLVVAIGGTIVIWVFLDDLETTSDRSLLIGQQATTALTETIDVAGQVLDAVDGGLATVQESLGTIDDVLQSTAGVAGAVGSMAANLPPGFAAIDSSLATLEGLATTIDSTLTSISGLPIVPDYNPKVPFSEAVGNLRDAITPIADIGTVSTELQDFAAGSGDLSSQLDSLAADVQNTRDALSGTDALLEQYRVATTEANQLATDTRNELAGSMDRMRVLIIALGLLLVLFQFVPWTLAQVLEGGVLEGAAWRPPPFPPRRHSTRLTARPTRARRWSPNPGKRWASGGDRPLLGNRVATVVLSRAMSDARPQRRRRWLVGIGVVLVLVIGAVVLLRTVVFHDRARAVTTSEAVDRYREQVSTTVAATTSVPPLTATPRTVAASTTSTSIAPTTLPKRRHP